MKFASVFVIISSLLFFYNNCSDNDGASVLSLKPVTIRCLHSLANDCNSLNDNSLSFIGLIQNPNSSCADMLSSTTNSNLFQLFDASSILQVNHSTKLNSLVATYTNWTSANGLSINTLNNATHTICGFIDTNADGLLNKTEPLLDLKLPLQEIHLLDLEAWDNY